MIHSKGSKQIFIHVRWNLGSMGTMAQMMIIDFKVESMFGNKTRKCVAGL